VEELAVKVLKDCCSHSGNPKDFGVVWERALALGLLPCRVIFYPHVIIALVGVYYYTVFAFIRIVMCHYFHVGVIYVKC